MKINLFLDNIKPISLNDSQKSGRNGRRYKTSKTLQFESAVHLELRKHRNEFNRFNKFFDENKHYITAYYRIFHDKVLKKDRTINKNGGDNSNTIKPLEDLIFKNLMADDSAVQGLYIEKFHSNNIRVEIELSIKELRHIQ